MPATGENRPLYEDDPRATESKYGSAKSREEAGKMEEYQALSFLKKSGINESFFKRRLTDQCEDLGMPLEERHFPKSREGWLVNGERFRRPEDALFTYFVMQGYSGSSREGGIVLEMMKAAGLDYLAKVNTFRDRADACTRYFEAQCQIHQDKKANIIDAVLAADKETVRRNINQIRRHQLSRAFHPDVQENDVLRLWELVSRDQISGILDRFIDNPYMYRKGWPDLTLVKNDEDDLRFIEVKTTDKIRPSQAIVISQLILPFGLPFSVVRLKPAKAEKQPQRRSRKSATKPRSKSGAKAPVVQRQEKRSKNWPIVIAVLVFIVGLWALMQVLPL